MTEKYGSGRFCSKSCANSRQHSDETKAKISNTINKFIVEHGQIGGGTRCYKHGTYQGIPCDSSWELAYVIYCKDHHIDINRNTDSFEYSYNNKKHLYFPDFILDGQKYIEIKGWYTDKIVAKLEQFPKDRELIVIDEKSIQSYLDYAIEKYGEAFWQIYDTDQSLHNYTQQSQLTPAGLASMG